MNSNYLKRIKWIILFTSITGLFLSVILPTSGMGDAGRMYPDELRGSLYFVTGDIIVDITVTNGSLSFYVFDWQNSLEILESQSLVDVTPVFAKENITTYSGVIEIPSAGFYSFLAMHYGDSSVSFRVDLTRVLPQKYILWPSFFILGAYIIIALIERNRLKLFADGIE
ncbi:MAG: hypothetical protein GF411_05845 [Candidatus Lokiarchaeota archaeon]|nr:hypothetical protein [Candidatus Lokiarchaeota archaeon]